MKLKRGILFGVIDGFTKATLLLMDESMTAKRVQETWINVSAQIAAAEAQAEAEAHKLN